MSHLKFYAGQTEDPFDREKKVIFVCSPFQNKEVNVKKARACCRSVLNKGHVPLAPHLIYPQFLQDDKPEEREIGLDCGLTLMNLCDEVWVFGKEITSGMRREVEYASERRIPIYHKQVPRVRRR
jgi:hypothetical protein